MLLLNDITFPSFIAQIFQKFLAHQISSIRRPLQVHYLSADNECRQWTFSNDDILSKSTPGTNDRSVSAICKELHILTPAFYSRVVCYQDLSAAVDEEIFTVEQNQTAKVSNIDATELCSLLLPMERPDTNTLHVQDFDTFFNNLLWKFIQFLRYGPVPGSYPNDRTTHNCKRLGKPSGQLISQAIPGFNSLDHFVCKTCSRGEIKQYQCSVLWVLLLECLWKGGNFMVCYIGQMLALLFQMLV